MKLAPWEPDLRTIVDRIDSGDIDLQPDFQRQEVWSPTKKKKLIDTVLRGWSIPPIFLVVTKDGRMEVLDGQQRLAALRDFVHNNFSIDGKITPHDQRIQSLHGKVYRRLDDTEKRLMNQYTLRCFRITDYEPDEPSELFYRLNQPSMLTAGEQRNAFYGPAREQLKSLVSEFERGGNDKKSIGFSNARLAYDDIIARLLFFLEARTFSIKSTESLISQRFKDRSEFGSEVVQHASRAIHLFTAARQEAEGVRLNKASTLSWLLFFARFGNTQPKLGFMSTFSNLVEISRIKNFVKDAYITFQDRASLRVTDVSSVVYRDFSLWYSYFIIFGRSCTPPSVDAATIELVYDTLSERDDVTFEFVLSQFLDLDSWSRLQ